MSHCFKILRMAVLKIHFLKIFYLKIFILSALLISCSGDKRENAENENTGDKTATSGSAGNTGSAEQTEKHWILSVPFQKIEAGTFKMGSPTGESNRESDENQVDVTISKPFEIMTKEVTQSQWVKVMDGENPSMFKLPANCDDYDSENNMCPNHPVEQVSWDDVQKFIEKINNALGLTGCNGTPTSSVGCYRLPTEAEWEYSARGGTTTVYSFGNDPSNLGDYAWYMGNSDKKTHPVGLKKPNPWGLYDVHGNVWEWVQDKHHKDLLGGEAPLRNSGSYRVVRGGSYVFGPEHLRSANRSINEPTEGNFNVGFRLVKTL